MAVSRDNGMSWEKIAAILPDPPDDFDVTGWRDPHVFLSSRLAKVLDVDSDIYFMVLSSGERGVGGRAVLYTSSNLLDWAYISTPLFAAAFGDCLNQVWSPKMGWNFEMTSTIQLSSKYSSIDFIITGIEGERDVVDHDGHTNAVIGGRYEKSKACFYLN